MAQGWLLEAALGEAFSGASPPLIQCSTGWQPHAGSAIDYQGRKAARTTNLLFLADSRDQPLACSRPQAGNHHDLFDIEISFGELCTLLEEAQISLGWVFLNADSGFDAKTLRDNCFRRGIEANITLNPRARKGGRRHVFVR